MPDFSHEHGIAVEPTYQEVSPVKLLWENRYWIVVWTGLFSVLVAFCCLMYFVLFPSSDSVYCHISTFPAIVKDDLPLNDIISTTVLDRTYESSSISEYMDSREFKDSIIIQKDTREGFDFIDLQFVNYFKPNLRVTGIDSEYYRNEFEKAKAQILKSASQTVRFLPVKGIKVPTPVCAETLTRLLNNWALFCVETRGLRPYPFEMVGVDLLQQMDKNKDEPFILLNELKNVVHNLETAAKTIADQPGILFLQAPSGMSIKTLLIQISNLTNLQIKPLESLVRQGRLYHDPLIVKTYIDEVLYKFSIEKERYEKSIEMLDETLATYSRREIHQLAPGQTSMSGTSTPNTMDNFVQGLVSLAKEGEEAKYRQQTSERILLEGKSLLTTKRDISYYSSFDPEVAQPTDEQAIPATFQEELWEVFKAGFDVTLAETKRLQQELLTLEQMNRELNLDPQSMLYSIGPILVIPGSFPLKKVAIMAFVSMALFIFFICFMLIMSQQMRGNEL